MSIYLTEEQAYECVVACLPKKIESESKENGNHSGELQVYKHEQKWFLRYLDVHIEVAYILMDAIEEMKRWLIIQGILK